MTDYTPEGLSTFGKLILKLKEDNNWNYLQAARALGFGSPTTVSAWVKNIENPTTEPNFKNLGILAPHIMNPVTGIAFTGDELIQVCQGSYPISDEQIKECSFRVDSQGYPVEQRPVLPEYDSITGVPRGRLDDVQAVHLGPHYIEMANQYWYSTIEPGIELMLNHVGDPQPDGSVRFESQEYKYHKDSQGLISVTPKDGRHPLTPETMNNRDWQVMRALSQKAFQKFGGQSQGMRSVQPSRGPKV